MLAIYLVFENCWNHFYDLSFFQLTEQRVLKDKPLY